VVDAVNLPHHHVHDHAHPPVSTLVLVRMSGRRAGRKYADVAVWTSLMAGQQTVNMDTVGGLVDYEIEKNDQWYLRWCNGMFTLALFRY
jgi:hypothetical protein